MRRARDPLDSIPLAYLLTFRTYGTWLPGDERGWVDRDHNQFGTERHGRNDYTRDRARASMDQPPMNFGPEERATVDAALRAVCEYKRWILHEQNVRSNHAHMVVAVPGPPEPAMDSLKAWATRRLREAGLIQRQRHVWERHGSTRYLWDRQSLEGAIDYVRNWQDR